MIQELNNYDKDSITSANKNSSHNVGTSNMVNNKPKMEKSYIQCSCGVV